MKRILLVLAALLFAVVVPAQTKKVAEHVEELVASKVPFKKIVPYKVSGKVNADAEKVAGDATYATLQKEIAADVAANRYEYIEMELPYNGKMVTMQLYRVELLAEGFHADTDKASGISVERGAHYRGIIKGDSRSIAAFNFFRNEVNGIVSSQAEGNIVAGKLQIPGNTSDYIIYSDGKMKVPNTFHCDVNDDQFGDKIRKSVAQTERSVQSNKCVTVYFEIDYDLFQQNGSSTEQTTNWMNSVFNNVQTLYANDGITVALKSIYIWTTDDPYEGQSSSDYLGQFSQVRPVFDGDVGQLVGIDEGGLGGVAATIGGICGDFNFSYADVMFSFATVPSFSWTVEVITHELGHLLGSPHTHGCYWNGNNTAIDGCGTQAGYVEGNCAIGPIPSAGTIMSYCHLVSAGINFANGFGPQPAGRILTHVNGSSCLSTDCINTCINTVASYSIINTGLNSVTIQWDDIASSGPWQVAYGSVNSAIFFNWQTATTPTFTATGLNPNTYYKFAIRPICPTGISAANNSVITATAADYCSGIAFTDTGGTSGGYPNRQRVVRTFRPENPDQNIIVTFNAFDTEADFDFLYVYDGPDVNSPLIGAYSGTEGPGTVESTAPDGSLTFEFVSDDNLTGAGWAATVSCSVLSTSDAAFEGFAYYPNPAKGWVTLRAAEQLEGVAVYNVAGQLLVQKEINATGSTVDISAFADGVYFFKVTGNGKEANFRIIKQN